MPSTWSLGTYELKDPSNTTLQLGGAYGWCTSGNIWDQLSQATPSRTERG